MAKKRATKKKKKTSKRSKRAPPKSIDPAKLSAADTAALLSSASGVAITEDMVKSDIDAGAPTNRNRTINLVHYTAWLARERTAHQP